MPKTQHWLNRWWLRYEYKHTTLAILTIVLFVLLLDSALLAGLFSLIEGLGYWAGFIAGVLSVSFFTAVPAVVLLIDLASRLDAHWLALAWGLGSTIGDWLILRFYQERVLNELQPVFRRLRIKRLVRLMRHQFTSWILFLGGAAFIASPLPDEVGLSLMGLAHLKRPYMLFMCFLLNAFGALVIILIAASSQSG